VLGALDLLDRAALKAGLAAAMVKRAEHLPAYDVLFDLWFPARVGDGSDELGDDPGHGPDSTDDAAVTAAMRDQLAAALLAGDDAALRELAVRAVGALGRADAEPGRQSYFAYRVLRALSPDTLVAALAAGLSATRGDGAHPSSAFAEQVSRRAARERVERFARLVDAEVRRRLADERGVATVAATAVAPLPEQVEFLGAGRDELAALRRQVHPLARRLATRLAARRRLGHDGRLDVRRTVRASLGAGGVPVDPRYRPRRPHKPELVVLCDMSGSVASFARFTLLLAWALQEQFTKVRAFGFVDGCDEITRHLAGADDAPEALARVVREARLVWFDGHSDYGHAFEVFADRYGGAVTPRTSLLVLGDGRTNYRDPGLPVLRTLVATARHAYWLNPEARGRWGSGDSAAPRYAEVVEMVECRTVAQLERFVTRLLPGGPAGPPRSA
jgi:uncharacterized protein with von Willebrand factor type A (vWA) domain